MKGITVLGLTIEAAVYIPVLYLIGVTVLLLVKKILFDVVRRLADKTRIRLDNILLNALDKPLLLLIFVGVAFVLDNIFQFSSGGELLVFIDIAFKVTAVVAVVMFSDNLFKGLIDTYSEKIFILKHSSGLVRGVLRAVVLGLGLLILLDSFGISITPVIASLGIGSLAVALALQPTLENFFSGIQLIADKPISVGHFIELESGEKGYVEKIGWRSTCVKMLSNNVVVIPNKVLVDSRLTNYYYPQKETSVYAEVGVHYDSDLEKVERVTKEVAVETLKEVYGGVSEFEPLIRFHTFNDSSVDLKVVLRAQEFVDGYLIKHEFVKRLHKRYKEEGIVIPYPIRTLDWNPGSEALKLQRVDDGRRTT